VKSKAISPAPVCHTDIVPDKSYTDSKTGEHPDYFRTGSGPWDLTQTSLKYAAIVKDFEINIM